MFAYVENVLYLASVIESIYHQIVTNHEQRRTQGGYLL